MALEVETMLMANLQTKEKPQRKISHLANIVVKKDILHSDARGGQMQSVANATE